MDILCPICGQELSRRERAYRCAAGHSFDIARQGYVNLLPVQQKHTLQPGDTAEQVLARRRFLDGGFYAPLAHTLCDLAQEAMCKGPILDVGCGEGYYAAKLSAQLGAELVGIDISKEAVRCASGRYKDARWFCATASHLPIKDDSVGVLTSLFALTVPSEFYRVLRPDGCFIQVLAAPDHLLGLKSIIYPKLVHKEKTLSPQLEGFTLAKSVPLRFSFDLCGQAVQDLLYMTPHAYRISAEGAERLRKTQVLSDTASCVLNLYFSDKK